MAGVGVHFLGKPIRQFRLEAGHAGANRLLAGFADVVRGIRQAGLDGLHVQRADFFRAAGQGADQGEEQVQVSLLDAEELSLGGMCHEIVSWG